MDRWIGKVAVVTGASAGIGLAIVEELASRGLVVVGLARREIIPKRSGVGDRVHFVKCDVTKETDIIAAFEWIEKNLGGVDLLINSAGILPVTSLNDGDVQLWKNALDVNVVALSTCTKEALKTMRKRGDNGHIIHVNSIAGHKILPIPKFGMYTASKHAVTALAESLRLELAQMKSKIKVTNLSPGIVHTEMARNAMKTLYNREVPSVDDETPEAYLSAQDLAESVINIISMKPHVQVEEFTLQAIGNPH